MNEKFCHNIMMCLYGDFFFHCSTALVCLGLLIVVASRSYSDTPHSVGLLWTSDWPDADTSTSQHS
jgi:hypothetical protein